MKTWLSKLWDRFWNGSPRWAGLTVEESEEYDRLCEVGQWRVFHDHERIRYHRLDKKVSQHGA